jgi:hypothetical protein
VTRVNVVIFYPRAAPGAGPLTEAFATLRWENVNRQAVGFERVGADVRVLDDLDDDTSFGQHVRETVEALGADGLVLLGSGSIPLATAADRRAFVEAAAGPAGHALANNRYSADIVAVAGAARLADLPDLRADNGLPRWLSETAGFQVADLRRRWRLQVDLDTPLDALLVPWLDAEDTLLAHDVSASVVRTTLGAVVRASRDPRCELVVAGRASAAGLAWLERSTASRTRALVEERGFRTRSDGQRPVRSTLGLLLDRDGPRALGTILAGLGDAALVDSRVLLAHRFGADELGWPGAEDRFSSDLLLPERIGDPWLRELTEAAVGASIPILLGGHTLVGPGLRLVLAKGRSWT